VVRCFLLSSFIFRFIMGKPRIGSELLGESKKNLKKGRFISSALLPLTKV
jgi:hypothetical protein